MALWSVLINLRIASCCTASGLLGSPEMEKILRNLINKNHEVTLSKTIDIADIGHLNMESSEVQKWVPCKCSFEDLRSLLKESIGRKEKLKPNNS